MPEQSPAFLAGKAAFHRPMNGLAGNYLRVLIAERESFGEAGKDWDDGWNAAQAEEVEAAKKRIAEREEQADAK